MEKITSRKHYFIGPGKCWIRLSQIKWKKYFVQLYYLLTDIITHTATIFTFLFNPIKPWAFFLHSKENFILHSKENHVSRILISNWDLFTNVLTCVFRQEKAIKVWYSREEKKWFDSFRNLGFVTEMSLRMKKHAPSYFALCWALFQRQGIDSWSTVYPPTMFGIKYSLPL